MTVEVKELRVLCPLCKKEAKIEVPIFLVNEAQDGVLKVSIPRGACCDEHSFMVYIDKKFRVRGYQNADIEFRNGPTISITKKAIDAKKEGGLKDFRIQDITSLLGMDISSLILRTILVEKPVFLLENFDLYNRVDKTVAFLSDMESDDLQITSQKFQQDDLKNLKRNKKINAFMVAPLYKAITRSPFREETNTRFESNLLNETMEIPDRDGQIIFLRKELIKITRVIEEFVKMLKDVDKMYEEDIPGITQKKFNYKLDSKNIDVIREVIAFKHDATLASKIINKSLDKIRTDLW
ncbi:hypothetical protein GF325_15390 [Candidatus Bathyarchaeota archaeon]|nr:hypothetical protein [Candidatus Bathyarchaeota archaeon]